MSRWLFRHRLAVMLAAFAAGLGSTWLSRARGVQTAHPILLPLWKLVPDPAALTTTLVVTGLGCLIAFLLRVFAEARLGRAVYGQGETAGLVREGLFARSRNPLYLGTLIFFCAALLLWSPLVVWAALSALFLLALHRMVLHEEVLLAERLGDPYRRYLHEVPRWLPRLSAPPAPAVTSRALASAVLGNLGLLSLGSYRLAIALGAPPRPSGVANVVLVSIWLGVLLWRRWR